LDRPVHRQASPLAYSSSNFVVPPSCQLCCRGIDSTLAFCEWNSSRRKNPSLIFELPSSPRGIPLNKLIIQRSEYPTIEEIDDGASAVVWRSQDPLTGQAVALKVMKHKAMDAEGRLRFTREVEILASVDHPTLLTLRGFVPLDGDDSPAIVTDFMPHGSYDRLIEEEKNGKRPPDWDKTSRFIATYGISVGMKVLHSQRIIHRDLKPANVFLDDSFEPRVADFGLAKSVEQGQSQNQTTFGGTTRFMAPEIHMDEPYDWSADV